MMTGGPADLIQAPWPAVGDPTCGTAVELLMTGPPPHCRPPVRMPLPKTSVFALRSICGVPVELYGRIEKLEFGFDPAPT